MKPDERILFRLPLEPETFGVDGTYAPPRRGRVEQKGLEAWTRQNACTGWGDCAIMPDYNYGQLLPLNGAKGVCSAGATCQGGDEVDELLYAPNISSSQVLVRPDYAAHAATGSGGG